MKLSGALPDETPPTIPRKTARLESVRSSDLVRHAQNYALKLRIGTQKRTPTCSAARSSYTPSARRRRWGVTTGEASCGEMVLIQRR